MKPKAKPPKHLRAATRRWWEEVFNSYELESHHLKLLTAAGESWDRAVQARETLAKEGAYYTNRFSEPRSHPALAVERDSKTIFARLVRELNLDIHPPEENRPAGVRYNRWSKGE